MRKMQRIHRACQERNWQINCFVLSFLVDDIEERFHVACLSNVTQDPATDDHATLAIGSRFQVPRTMNGKVYDRLKKINSRHQI